MLALELGQTIIENKFLGLGDSVLGSSLVIEAWWGGGVDGGVKEHGCDRLATPSRNLSKAEVLRRCSERRVSLAGRRSRLDRKHYNLVSQSDTTKI